MTHLGQDRLQGGGRLIFARCSSRSLVSATALIAACGFAEAQNVNLLQDVNARGEKLSILAPNPLGWEVGYPASNVVQPSHFHTFLKALIPPGGAYKGVGPMTGPPASGYLAETPASLGCVYRETKVASGCNPNVVTTNPAGGSKAIALVDAGDYVTAASDLATFDTQYGLKAAKFTKIYGTGSPSNGCANGPTPPSNSGTGWDIEAALDIETAHAMAPAAHIYLVEANSSSFSDLFNAEQVAAICVANAGGGQVSNSWGGSEWSTETSYDNVFTGTNVVFFASAGDAPGTEYPSVSPNVAGVGGTHIARNQNNGDYETQAVWNYYPYGGATGGGPSLYEPLPSFQSAVASVIQWYNNGTSARGAPDLSADADPYSGVWVYNSTYYGYATWSIWGGTSLASPMTAGIFNHFGSFYASTNAMLSALYADEPKTPTTITYVVGGLCGPGGSADPSLPAGQGYDNQYDLNQLKIAYSLCTGVGYPHGKPF